MGTRWKQPSRWPVVGGTVRFFGALPKVHRLKTDSARQQETIQHLHARVEALSKTIEDKGDHGAADLSAFVLDLNHRFLTETAKVKAEASHALARANEVADETLADLTAFLLDLNHRFALHAAETRGALKEVRDTTLPDLSAFILDVNHRQSLTQEAVSTLMQHVSAAKAVSFELVRYKAEMQAAMARMDALEAGMADRDSRIERALVGHSTTLSHFADRLEVMAAAPATADDSAVIAEMQGRLDALVTQIESLAAAAVAPAPAPAPQSDVSDHRYDNLSSSVADLQAQNRQQGGMLEYLNGRVEFVRRELMFELRYGKGGSGGSASLSVEPRIVNAVKLDAARAGSGIRLNLGCGHIAKTDYLNVDARELPGVDIVADAETLPFGADEVTEISSSHLIEHFPQEGLVRSVLPYWKSLLKSGGRLHAVMPDGKAMLHEYVGGAYGFSDLRESLYGGQDYAGDFHYNLLTPESLTEILQAQGFRDVHIIAEGRRNGACYEFEIEAFKP